MKTNQEKFITKLNKKYPLAHKYLKINQNLARSTREEDNGETVYLTTMQVIPNTGELPKEKILIEIWNYVSAINKNFGMAGLKLQFIVKGDDGEHNELLTVILKDELMEVK